MIGRVLFVCVGNICRSPTAEALWNNQRVAAGMDENAWSAGLGAQSGRPVHPEACRLLLNAGVDASEKRSMPLRTAMLRESELVLVMERWQKAELEQRAPFARGRIFCLGHWSQMEIPDPYGASEEVFRSVYDLIDRGVSEWFERF